MFGACYAAEVGCQKVCLKNFHSGSRYKSFFYTEVKMLSLLCHYNLPWLHAICSDLNRCSILMSLHLYSVCDGKSLTVYNALTSKHEITSCNWKRVLLGCVAALVYLRSKNILHNDIKSDNILIEMLPSDYTTARSVLIDFNKARFSEDGVTYKLSNEDKRKYAKFHPQVAPEIRNGTGKQTFASDIYSLGRVFHKISSKVNTPVLIKLSEACLSLDVDKRPSASELNTFLTNLFL